jgi:predicted dehydrogenase
MHQSRRDFMKQSALLAGGLMAAPMIAGANYFSGSEEIIKVAVIGCGGRGTGAVIQALLAKKNVRLVAMADAFKDNVEKCYATITSDDVADGVSLKDRIDVPEERRFHGFDAYKKAIPFADVVILTTPPGFRPIHFEEAVRLGKHVFMEKPVATDPAGVKRVLEAAETARKKKLNVVVGLQRRYQNSYRELFGRKDLIGDITSAQVWWNSDGVWVRPRKEGMTEMEYQMRNWYYFNWLCGDHICEQHIHNIDVVNWFKNDFPVSAQGMGGREVRKGKDHGEIFDHHYVEFTYADGTVMNSQCRHIPGTMSKVDELIIGTKGRIYCGAAKITDHKGNALYQFDRKAENNPYQEEHNELFDAILKGEYRFDDTEIGAKSTLTAIIGRMATYSGQVIKFEEALNSGISIMPEEFSFTATPPVLPDENGYYPVAVPGVTKYF